MTTLKQIARWLGIYVLFFGLISCLFAKNFVNFFFVWGWLMVAFALSAGVAVGVIVGIMLLADILTGKNHKGGEKRP